MDKKIKFSLIASCVMLAAETLIMLMYFHIKTDLLEDHIDYHSYTPRTPRPFSREERPSKIPEVERESDFVNKIDCNEYFAGKEPVYDEELEGYLVSHNMFYRNDGRPVFVEITSTEYENGVFGGMMYSHYLGVNGEGVQTPCAYDSDKRSALNYTYAGHFSLSLDDYNNDGNPDYLIRTGDPQDGGAYYYIEYSRNEAYSVFHTNFLTEKQNSDSAVFVYGQTADSIRLDHLDMDHFFFQTYEGGRIVPYVVGSNFRRDMTDYTIGGRLYSAFYENGVLTVKSTDAENGMEMYEESVKIIVRRLDERAWTGHDEFTVSLERNASNGYIHTAEIEHTFEKGLYQVEFITPDGSAYAEFMVRT